MRTGILLAGGANTRFGGTPKGLTRLQGTPVVTRVAHALAPHVAELRVVLAPHAPREPWEDALHGIPHHLVHDAAPHAGPAAALRGALLETDTEVAVAPTDAPLLTSAVYARLWERLTPEDDGAVARTNGVPNPLIAVYRAPALRAALDGVDAPRAALQRLRLTWVDDLPTETLRGFNTPEELAALAADL